MKLLTLYQNFLQQSIFIVEAFTYTISFLIITVSIINSTYIYISEYKTPQKAFIDTKLNLGESVALALSFILGVEILKLFYIKSYKQLIIVASLVLIKLSVSYFLLNEINKTIKQ